MRTLLACLTLVIAAIVTAEDPAWTRGTGLKPFTYGVTRDDAPLVAWMNPEAWRIGAERRHMVLVGSDDDLQRALSWLAKSDTPQKSWNVSAIVRPGRFTLPKDGFYDAREAPESRYLWRFLALTAADLLLEFADDNGGDLAAAVSTQEPGGVGRIPARRIACEEQALIAALKELPSEPSAARRELQRRAARSASEIAAELGVVYGKELKEVAYIPALALVAKQRLGDHSADDVRLPFVTERTPVPKSGSEQAGHLYFRELALAAADASARERWTKLVQIAADTKVGHNEMSDAVFMTGPILAAAGRLTKDAAYFDRCFEHLQLMRKLCLRDDGLYRHSPLCEAAWGRGNGFPALGLDYVLEDWPKDDARRKELVAWQCAHLTQLASRQEIDGSWRQVIDDSRSYREFTATAMIGYALFRGMQRGDLPRAEFEPAARRAWDAIKLRIGPKGALFDVCTGTGKQKTLRDYFDRPAILGVDARGGAMALMLTSAVIDYEASRR